jgi:hypothetical protein
MTHNGLICKAFFIWKMYLRKCDLIYEIYLFTV